MWKWQRKSDELSIYTEVLSTFLLEFEMENNVQCIIWYVPFAQSDINISGHILYTIFSLMYVFSSIINNLDTEVDQLFVWCSSIPVYAFVFISNFVSYLFISTV
jgi:hypothetical protein